MAGSLFEPLSVPPVRIEKHSPNPQAGFIHRVLVAPRFAPLQRVDERLHALYVQMVCPQTNGKRPARVPVLPRRATKLKTKLRDPQNESAMFTIPKAELRDPPVKNLYHELVIPPDELAIKSADTMCGTQL